MNPALSQELFFDQEQLQKHATLGKNTYCVYGTLNEEVEVRGYRGIVSSTYLIKSRLPTEGQVACLGGVFVGKLHPREECRGTGIHIYYILYSVYI